MLNPVSTQFSPIRNYLIAIGIAFILGIAVFFLATHVLKNQEAKKLEAQTASLNHTVTEAINKTLAKSLATDVLIISPQNLASLSLYEQSLYYRSREIPEQRLTEIRFINKKPMLVNAEAIGENVVIKQVAFEGAVKAIELIIAQQQKPVQMQFIDSSTDKVISSFGQINTNLPSSTSDLTSLQGVQLVVQKTPAKFTPTLIAALSMGIFAIVGMLWALQRNKRIKNNILNGNNDYTATIKSHGNNSGFDFLKNAESPSKSNDVNTVNAASARKAAFADRDPTSEQSIAIKAESSTELNPSKELKNEILDALRGTKVTELTQSSAPAVEFEPTKPIESPIAENSDPDHKGNVVEFVLPNRINNRPENTALSTGDRESPEQHTPLLETVSQTNFSLKTEPPILSDESSQMISEPLRSLLNESAEIFRSYDIRGNNTLLSETLVTLIGKALGTQFICKQTHPMLVIGCDARSNSALLSQWLINGLNSAGISTIFIGFVPTPAMHFAAHTFTKGNGIMITASHSPKDCNGFKWILGGNAPSEEDIQEIYSLIAQNDFAEGAGTNSSNTSILESYCAMLSENISISQSLKIAIDGMHGTMGNIAKKVFEGIGALVFSRAMAMNGEFPEGNPDPTEPGRLDSFAAFVTQNKCDIGFAFDGDGDRLVIFTEEGKALNPDLSIMLLAKIALATQSGGDVFIDVKCSRATSNYISSLGGFAKTTLTGNTHLKNQIAASANSVLGAEIASHYVMKQPYGQWSDDALFAALSICEYITAESTSLGELLAELPKRIYSHDHYVDTDTNIQILLQELTAAANSLIVEVKISSLDGLRLDFAEGFAVIRKSNTANNKLSVRMDADSLANFEHIKGTLLSLIEPINAKLAHIMTNALKAIE